MGSWSGQPRVCQCVDPEPTGGDQIIDFAVEMTPSCHSRPERIEPILPAGHTRLRRATVLDEQQRTAGLQHPAHFG